MENLIVRELPCVSISVAFCRIPCEETRWYAPIVWTTSFSLKNDRDSIKNYLIRMLTLNELAVENNHYIAEGLKLQFVTSVWQLLDDNMACTIATSHNKVCPYAQLNRGNRLVAMPDEYLVTLPNDLGEIVKEIEADREKLIKQYQFELKLDGIVLTKDIEKSYSAAVDYIMKGIEYDDEDQ